ncbi:MAG: hypothetical protein F4Z92_10440, partial [Gemmatimonadetes bacterium]|nr:hypothetical protein [Gemmatimonadota bacterium]
PIPPQLGALRHLSRLNLSDNRLTGSIPAELAGLSNLQALRLFGNDLTGPIPAALVELADLATLNLGDNQLSGPLPAEFGHAAKLEDLDLRSNSLSGPVPSEFGNLTMLTSLIVADNPDLVGPLPAEITALDRLARFMAGGTGLCRPAGTRFDTWFGTIPERRIVRCEGGASVYLTQTVQSWDDPVPLLAGEPALLRVFVTAPNGGAATMPAIQATFFVDGDERHTVHIPASTASIPHEVVQSDLELSANSEIPASVIVPGLEFVLDVDPEGALDSSLGVTKRIPDSGRISVDVRRVPPFQLTLIPLLSGTEADSSVMQSMREIAADPGGHELVDRVRTLLPVGRIDVSAREPVISTARGTYTLLAQVGAIRLMEGGSGHWMGIFGSPPPRGRAFLGGWTSVSSPDARIIAHELGHNLSLQHAPCGFPAGVDPWFPYVNGNIGAWGYDLERGALVGPHSVDLMSYCTHGRYWISDYHYNRALDHRLASVRVEPRALAFRTRSLMVWGGRDEDGVPYLDPAFVVEATPTFPPAGGEYTIEGSSADGTPIFSHTFDMPVTADAEGQEASFVFALPVEPEWGENLAHITLSGPGGSASLDEKTDRSMAILRDPRTRQIRAFLSDYPNASLARAAVGVAGAGVATPALEVLYSRGIPDAPAWNR